jgi:hypothetical protein
MVALVNLVSLFGIPKKSHYCIHFFSSDAVICSLHTPMLKKIIPFVKQRFVVSHGYTVSQETEET